MMKFLYFLLMCLVLNQELYAFQMNTVSTADSLLQMMTEKEKLSQLFGEKSRARFIFRFAGAMISGKHFATLRSGAIPRLNIPEFSFSDGPRGIVVGRNTCFPVTICRGASFNRELEHQTGVAMGKEAIARKANYFGGVCINLVRNPKGGRTQETYGEDPFLLGEMGSNLIQGVQSRGVMACVKHFALNNSEDNRYAVNVEADEKTLREVYLPHFEKAVKEAGVASVMSAYNKFRGAYCGEQPYLLEKILREEWGFQGFVTSDWEWGVRDAEKGIRAGMDVEMPHRKVYGKNLESALKAGKISRGRIDTMVARIVATKLKFGKPVFEKLRTSDWEKHRNLSLKLAQEGMVLLKNDQVLPFQVKQGSRVLVLGRLSNKDNTGDKGSSYLLTHYAVSPYEGIQKYVESRGGTVKCYSGEREKKTVELINESDLVVLCVGYDAKDEGECIYKNPEKRTRFLLALTGGDRDSMGLHAEDVNLINLCNKLKAKTAVVFFGGGVPEMYSWIERAPSLLMAWYPGMEGGNALSGILFGDVSPSGKLPVTVFKEEKDYPGMYGNGSEVKYDYLHGYRLADRYPDKVLFPFGFGLSYSKFQMGIPVLNRIQFGTSDTVFLKVEVRNTGSYQAAEVVQVYVGYPESGMSEAVKVLCAFEKKELLPGEMKEMQFAIPVGRFRQYNSRNSSWEIEKGDYTLYTGNSSSLSDLQLTRFNVK